MLNEQQIKMQDISMDEPDNCSNGYENYCRLHRTVTFLKNRGEVTEEWMIEHREYILRYRKEFPDFSQVHLEVDDEHFRENAQETEEILASLVDCIRNTGFFNVLHYLMLNEHIIAICDHIFTQDELDLCMSKLSI